MYAQSLSLAELGHTVDHVLVGARIWPGVSWFRWPSDMNSRKPAFTSGAPRPASSNLWEPSPQALTLLGETRLIALSLKRLFLREYQRGLRHFYARQVCLGYGPEPGPTRPSATFTGRRDVRQISTQALAKQT